MAWLVALLLFEVTATKLFLVKTKDKLEQSGNVDSNKSKEKAPGPCDHNKEIEICLDISSLPDSGAWIENPVLQQNKFHGHIYDYIIMSITKLSTRKH